MQPANRYTPPVDGQVRLLTKVARMYHERGIRQADIATALNISQAKVSRLLKRAAAVGIVRTTVTVAPGVYADLEERARDAVRPRRGGRRRRGSQDADEAETFSRRSARARRAYLEATLSGNDRIGVSSWSQTLLAMVDRMRPFAVARRDRGRAAARRHRRRPRCRATRTASLGELARMLGAEPVYVQAPGIVAGPDHPRQPARTTPRCSEVTRRWRELTMAIMGIGSIEPSDVLADERQRVRRRRATRDSWPQGAVGDICHRVFRADGTVVRGELDDRIIAIPVDDLLRVPRRVGIAGGPRKLERDPRRARGRMGERARHRPAHGRGPASTRAPTPGSAHRPRLHQRRAGA